MTRILDRKRISGETEMTGTASGNPHGPSTKSAADTSWLTNGSSHCEQPGLIWFSLSSRQENDDERRVKVYVMATKFAVKSMDHETTFCASRASKLAY